LRKKPKCNDSEYNTGDHFIRTLIASGHDLPPQNRKQFYVISYSFIVCIFLL